MYLLFQNKPRIAAAAAAGGQRELGGPLGSAFDVGPSAVVPVKDKNNGTKNIPSKDDMFGQRTWEQAESMLQKLALDAALEKAGMEPGALQCVFAGDLLGQSIASTFGLLEHERPLIGLYGACSTMAESLLLAAAFVNAGYVEAAAAVTSSHFASAERHFRMPLAYGSQKPPTAGRTATAAGAVLVSGGGMPVNVESAYIGRVVDGGITDVSDMGNAMAPAAHDTLTGFFSASRTNPADYDLILTGDLGLFGRRTLIELCKRRGIDLGEHYHDCGLMLFDTTDKDVGAGGSGCGWGAMTAGGRW